jgi:proteasome lid subunit RPN8/RPN11
VCCKKQITSKSKDGLTTNFSAHVKTHGISMKEYKALALRTNVSPAPAQREAPNDYGGGFGDGGFGGDEWIDQGANDARFDDARDEPEQANEGVDLIDWFASKKVRQAIVDCPQIWLANRHRMSTTKYETKMTGLYAISHAIERLTDKKKNDLIRGLTVPATLSQLEDLCPRQLLLALTDLVSLHEWVDRLREVKSLGQAIKSLTLLARLIDWAVGREKAQLNLKLRVGDEYPEHVRRASGWVPQFDGILAQLRDKAYQLFRAGKLTLIEKTSTWTRLADELYDYCKLRVRLEKKWLEQLEEIREQSIEELRSLALLVLTGYADIAALRHTVGHSNAACLDKHLSLMGQLRTLTLYRLDGKLYLKVVGEQKNHLMQAYDLSCAPIACAVLGKLLDHPSFEHGGQIVGDEEHTLLNELQQAADLLDVGYVPVTLRNETQRGSPINANVMRRWHASIAYLALLWDLITDEQFVAVSYVQQHEPKTVLTSYVKLTGINVLLPEKSKNTINHIESVWSSMTARDASGALSVDKHNLLIDKMWSALHILDDVALKLGSKEISCPKCGAELDRVRAAEHLAECLGQLGKIEAMQRIIDEKQAEIDKALEDESVQVVLDDEELANEIDKILNESNESDDDQPVRKGNKRKAATDAKKLLKVFRVLTEPGSVDDGEASFDLDIDDSSNSSNGGGDDSQSEPADNNNRTMSVPRKALRCFEQLARADRNEVLALMVNVDGDTELWLFEQECGRTSCAMSDHGNTQLADEFKRRKGDIKVVAWVHSHPGHDQFLSHVDVHTQKDWQTQSEDLVALVFAPNRAEKWAAYFLTDEQMSIAEQCEQDKPTTLANNCVELGQPKNYSKATIKYTSGDCLVVDHRKNK